MAKIKKDDTVLVIAGKDRGTTGKVISVDGNRVTVEGVNRQKRHTKETTGDRGVKVGGIITVEVSNRVKHGMYSKVMSRSSKLKAHDEQNTAGMGDRVLIMETRPLSATKRWRLVEILEKAK